MYDMLLNGIVIFALLLSDIMLIALGFMAARLRSPASEHETSSLHQEIKSVSLSLAALSERLVKLEIQIGQLRDQAGQQSLPLNRETSQKNFKVATKLALQGASSDEIVELCGLSRGEADLICMLHSSSQVSPEGVAGSSMPRPASRITDFSEKKGETPQSDEAVVGFAPHS